MATSVRSIPIPESEPSISSPFTVARTANGTPFNVDSNISWQDPLFDPKQADDIIFGGWDGDFLHGGAGDDAISGAEALAMAKVEVFPDDGTSNPLRTDGHVILTGYDRPLVVSDVEDDLGTSIHVLGFEALRAEEFAAYDEFDPLARIVVDTVDSEQFLLNFNAGEGEALMEEVSEALQSLNEMASAGDLLLADDVVDNLAVGIGQLEKAGLEAQAETDAALEVERLLEEFRR